MAAADLVLGFDVGTSAVKAALYAPGGGLVASALASAPLLLPQPGWAEQAPADWWAALQAVTGALLAAVPDAGARIAAIGFTAQMGCALPVDEEGEALANALIWLDTRSAGLARELLGGPVAGYNPLQLAHFLWLTGGAPNLSGKDAITKIAWLSRHRSDIWPRLHRLLDVKDYLVHRCTGRFVTTPDCAHLSWLYDPRPGHKDWSPALLGKIGLDRALLPQIASATRMVGGLTEVAASALGLRPGTPVAGGAGDLSAAALGAGNWDEGSLHLYLGTSAWLAARLPRSRVDPLTSIGSLSFADGEGYLLIATQENAGSSLRWGQKLLGLAQDDFAGLEAAAASAQPHRRLPFFFPWLMGERVPVDDAHIRGAFANLSLDSGRAEIAHALYEGVALNLCWAMPAFDRLSGRPGQKLRLVGGGGRSQFWAQLFANVMDREIELTEAPEQCGTLGAAMCAAVAAGWHPDLAAATSMSRPAALFRPDAQMRVLYAERNRAFRAFYPRVRGWVKA